MPRISLCISESVCSRQSGTIPGSSRSELPYELPLVSLLQTFLKTFVIVKMDVLAECSSPPLLNLFRKYISAFTIPQKPSTGQLSMQCPMRDMDCSIPCFESLNWNALLVYWPPVTLSPVDKASFPVSSVFPHPIVYLTVGNVIARGSVFVILTMR